MKQEQLQLTGGGAAEKRRELDFYPTPVDATRALMIFLADNFIVHGNDYVWEPACGNGAMADVIDNFLDNKCFASDIRETGVGIGGIDFLNLKADGETDYRSFDAIITNPPFNQSEEFIKQAVKLSKRVVCMLLKSQYWHAGKRLKLFKDCPPAYVLPLTWRPDFLEHERKPGDKKGAPTMEVAWTVWIKGVTETKYQLLPRPGAVGQTCL